MIQRKNVIFLLLTPHKKETTETGSRPGRPGDGLSGSESLLPARPTLFIKATLPLSLVEHPAFLSFAEHANTDTQVFTTWLFLNNGEKKLYKANITHNTNWKKI